MSTTASKVTKTVNIRLNDVAIRKIIADHLSKDEVGSLLCDVPFTVDWRRIHLVPVPCVKEPAIWYAEIQNTYEEEL
ncbi:MAG: hypothetical protein ACW987_19605 [Candidatus Thorarchaeota archaeon]